ncbi:MAG TPA: hypothetical protein VFT76_00165 [Actinomycetota bacterium]|nr:hypothetical protein [Actinomycetota bacterium]
MAISELREDMEKAIREQIKQLAKIRGVRRVDAAVSVASTFAENLSLSRGTTMEAYWSAMSSIADAIASQETGSR